MGESISMLTLRLTSFPPLCGRVGFIDGNKAAYPCSGPAPLQQLKASFLRPVATRLFDGPVLSRLRVGHKAI